MWPSFKTHHIFWPYLDHFETDYDFGKSIVGLLIQYNLSSSYVWSYLSHSKSNVDNVKSKVTLLSKLNLIQYKWSEVQSQLDLTMVKFSPSLLLPLSAHFHCPQDLHPTPEKKLRTKTNKITLMKQKGPHDAIRGHKGPYGTMHDHIWSNRTILEHEGPNRTKCDHLWPYGAKQDHTRLYGTIRGHRGP